MALQDELATPQGDVDLARDRLLVERSQAGDGSAFAELYTCYYDRLHRFCVRRLHDEAEGHDVAQEAFAKAWRALPSFGGERRFYPWLTVIAANLCTDVLRRRSRSNLTGDFDAVEKLETRPALDDSIEDKVVAGVENQMALAALDRLSERHRRVLVLREGSGWSYQRIASHEGVEISAIETLLWRARQALKREYAAVSGGALAGLLALPLAGGRSLVHLGRRVGAALAVRVPWVGHAAERVTGLQASLAAVAGSAAVAAVALSGLASPAPASSHTTPPAVVAPGGSGSQAASSSDQPAAGPSPAGPAPGSAGADPAPAPAPASTDASAPTPPAPSSPSSSSTPSSGADPTGALGAVGAVSSATPLGSVTSSVTDPAAGAVGGVTQAAGSALSDATSTAGSLLPSLPTGPTAPSSSAGSGSSSTNVPVPGVPPVTAGVGGQSVTVGG